MTSLQQIFPASDVGRLDARALERLYDYPDDEIPYVVANFVSSADGAVAIDGISEGLGTPADNLVLQLGTDSADAILVGAGTAVAEGFTGAAPHGKRVDRRRRFGRAPIPVTAVVTGSGRSLPPAAPVLTDTAIPTIIITTAKVPQDLLARWTDAGADVIVVGDDAVDLPAGLAELSRRGLHRVNCMGGPELFGSLLTAGLVDELRLTIAPLLVSGTADRIARGVLPDPTRLRLLSAVTADSALLLRYGVRNRNGRCAQGHAVR